MAFDFPYAMHVETIRKALWRPRSQAAVMVGSGFSRNADPMASAAPLFPLWGDIVTRLQKELASNNPDPLRLAEEYEYAASRTALDEILLEMIPDAKYQPGRLHELLLSLPWSDVFTANYDTLIERTRTKVHEIKYSVVLTPADIARSERPRIVKLHGSFPSHRPFIFTAEDYRKYPRDFAPFVNMVQQSIMENVFCMIGFSGNDPNFIQWIGWVRDQLGSSAPKIYLCDVLDMTPAKDRLYQSMRVVPIDLGPLVPRDTWTEEMRRPKALEWFLASLHQGKPLDLSQWPRKQEATQARFQILGLPPPLANPTMPAWMRAVTPPDVETLSTEVLKTQAAHWRSEREGYPGWVVIPEPNRVRILHSTRSWLTADRGSKIIEILDAGSASEKLEFLHELVWRVRHCLVPLPDWLSTGVAMVLERINPKPGLIKIKNLATEAEQPPGNTDALTERWVYLAFALVNHAWQYEHGSDVSPWIERLKDVVTLKPGWQAQWYYEQCWHHLLWLNEPATRMILDQWPAREGLPFWEAKRAAILATLGDLKDALHTAETALAQVRQTTTTASIDYVNLSEEGWLMALIGSLDLALDVTEEHRHEEITARLRELRRHRCDPMEDGNQRMHRLLESESLKPRRGKHGFDPGTRTTSITYTNKPVGDEWVLMHMLHDGSMPIRSGTVANYAKGVASSMRRLWPTSPRLAVGIGILGGIFDDLKRALGRVDIAFLDHPTACALYDWLFQTLSRALESVSSTTRPHARSQDLNERLLQGCPEVLSRLTLHVTAERLQAAFELVLKMYTLRPFLDFGRHSLVDSLLKRVLLTASTDQAFSWLPQLLALPIPWSNGHSRESAKDWEDPLSFIPWNQDWRRPTESEKASWAKDIERMIRLVQDGTIEERKAASFRLACVARFAGLTEKQTKGFVGALWSKTDNSGFPSHVGFEPWVLLKIPVERQPGEAQRAVARQLLEKPVKDFEIYMHWIDRASAYPWNSPAEKKTRIQWTPAEAATLLTNLLDWWGTPEPAIHSAWDLGFPNRVHQAMDLLGNVIIPQLDPADSNSIRSIQAMLGDFEQKGFSPVSVLPSLLINNHAQAEDTAKRIQRVLSSAHGSEVTSALQAVGRWIALAREKLVPSAPPGLLDGWVAIIAYRRQPGLAPAIEYLSEFVEKFGDEMTENHLQALSTALEYLLDETKPTASLDGTDELALTAEERINLRWRASELAASLELLHSKRVLSRGSQARRPSISRTIPR